MFTFSRRARPLPSRATAKASRSSSNACGRWFRADRGRGDGRFRDRRCGRAGRGCVAGHRGQSGAGASLRPGDRTTGQDRSDPRVHDRPLRRGDQARGAQPAGRGHAIAGRSGRAQASDHRNDRRRAQSGEARHGQADRQEHRPPHRRAREGAGRDRWEIDASARGSPAWRRRRTSSPLFRAWGRSPLARSSPNCPTRTLDGKRIASLAGLAPFTRQSGQWRGKAMIAGGRARVRSALFLAALTAARHNPVLKAFRDKKVAEGKPKMVAIIAVARKLLTILNAILRDKQQ